MVKIRGIVNLDRSFSWCQTSFTGFIRPGLIALQSTQELFWQPFSVG